jgi:hypothetical protein
VCIDDEPRKPGDPSVENAPVQMHAPHQLHQPHEPNEPHQPHQPHEPHQPIIGWWTAGYLALGLWLVHTLHVCRFLLVDWNQITAFPDWQVKPWTALWLGAQVPMVALVGVGAIRRWPGGRRRGRPNLGGVSPFLRVLYRW